MNKKELIAAVADRTGMKKKDAAEAVKAITDVIADEMAMGGKVQLVGFGTFSVGERAAREGRNPKTGEALHIEASKTARFKAGKALKCAVNA